MVAMGAEGSSTSILALLACSEFSFKAEDACFFWSRLVRRREELPLEFSEVWDVPDNEAVVVAAEVGEVPLPTTMLTYKITLSSVSNQAFSANFSSHIHLSSLFAHKTNYIKKFENSPKSLISREPGPYLVVKLVTQPLAMLNFDPAQFNRFSNTVV